MEDVEAREDRAPSKFERNDPKHEEEDDRTSLEDDDRKKKKDYDKRKEDSKRRTEESNNRQRRDDDEARETKPTKQSRGMSEEDSTDKKKRAVIREDMVQNAVQFLNNPSVRGTPLARKVAFLERKGLSSEEIKEALRRSGESRTSPADHDEDVQETHVRTRTVQRPPPPAPTQPQPSWKSLVVTTAAVVSVAGGLIYFAKNYIAPHVWHSASSIQTLKESHTQTTQTINEIKGQMNELKENLSSLKGLLQQTLSQQESKQKNDEITQLKKDLEALNGVSQQLVQDERAREVAELKSQISTLKASITARQSATAPPPIPNTRSTLTWTPVDNPKQIPSWQRPTTPTTTTTQTTATAATTATTVPSSPSSSESPDDFPQHTPYSQNYLDIMNTVNEHLPTAELNKRLGIRTDINDKPVGDVPLSKGSKQPRSKPWEKSPTTTTSAVQDVDETSTQKEIEKDQTTDS